MRDGRQICLLVATGGRGSAEAGCAVGRFDDEWRVGDVGGDGCDGRVDGGRDLGAFERCGEGVALA
jgi:hypothetical protein